MRRRHLDRWLWVGAACLLTLAPPIAPAARAGEPIRIGYIPVLGSSALFVLEGEGWARQQGLDLRLIRFQAGTEAIQALSTGRIDAYVAGVLPLLVARSHGVDVRVVATGAVDELALVARGPLAVRARTDAPMDFAARVAAFTRSEGRKPRIAAQPIGSVPDTLLRYWLSRTAHVDPSAVDIVGVDIDAAQQALLAGAVDAAVLREPALTIVRHRLPGSAILAPGGALMPDQPGSVLAVLDPDAPDRATWIARLVALFGRATTLLATRPAEAAPFVQRYLGNGILSPAIISEALAAPDTRFVNDIGRIIGPTRTLQGFEVSLGVVKRPTAVDTLFAEPKK